MNLFVIELCKNYICVSLSSLLSWFQIVALVMDEYTESVHAKVLTEWVKIINIPTTTRKEFNVIIEDLLSNLG